MCLKNETLIIYMRSRAGIYEAGGVTLCVCFMLFDGLFAEGLTVCQCYSLTADVSGLRGGRK